VREDLRHDAGVPRLLVIAVLLTTAACADVPPPVRDAAAGSSAGMPQVAEIVCESDGSTTVRTPEVVVQADGIHVHVVNHLSEPASLGALRWDAVPGETDFVSVAAPGSVDAACWQYSKHSTGEAPRARPVRVLDPRGIYVGGELDCARTSVGTIYEFHRQPGESPVEAGPVPLDAARSAIGGLKESDELIRTGYPQQVDGGVVVSREGRWVAAFSFINLDGREWAVAASTICSSVGLGAP
jgi:hypothetical protein